MLALTVAFLDHPLAYVLRVKAAWLFSADPDVALTFVREPSDRPVLTSGTVDTPMIVMDPCVIADADGFHLFFSSFFCDALDGLSPFWRVEFGAQFDAQKLTTGIAYAFSADRGMSWEVRPTPLLLPVADGWDDFRVETPSAVVVDDILHLFYCADQKHRPARYQIGEASLALNGETLREALYVHEKTPSRGRTTPVVAGITDKSSFRNNVQEPSVLYFDGRFELYFVGLQFSEPNETVDHPGQLMRRVGLGRAVLDRSLNLIEVSDKPLIDLANIIEVKRTDDRLFLFTTMAGEGSAHRRERIGYHTSRNGRTWSRVREVVSSLPSGFDSWGCMSPTVVHEADRWVLFYTALENLDTRPDERWGLPLGNDGWLFGTLGRAESSGP
jgi:predicted GH43/DUF377 family glycosyl hydrolase